MIRVLLTLIQKEAGRERTWDWEGEKKKKNPCFSSPVKKRRKRNTLRSVFT